MATTLRMNELYGLGMRVDVLTRGNSPIPLASHRNVRILTGDVRTFSRRAEYDLVIHAAANSSALPLSPDLDPESIVTTIVDGSRRIIDLAARSNARVLFLSSGAVYGPQTEPVDETATTGPDPLDPSSAYGEAKRFSETLFALATEAGAIEAVVARLFTFVGPGVPLAAHYAAGNFLHDAINKNPITLHGDGRPRRSYLYCGDLPEWCWALIGRGKAGVAYNVGSDEDVSIRELAEIVAKLADPPLPVRVLSAPGQSPAPSYVPSVARILDQLGLVRRTGLEQALRKTYEWLLRY